MRGVKAPAEHSEVWVKPSEAGKILGIKRDTVLKYASLWKIRMREYPRESNCFRLLNLADILRFRDSLEAGASAGIEADAETARTAAC